MPTPPVEAAVRRQQVVPAPVERAFAVFTERLGEWWPPEYSWSESRLESAAVEPRAGGRWYERDEDGREHEWGRVLACEPPHRLLLSWHVRADRTREPDPAKASEVEVRFTAEGPAATRLQLEHREISRHGEGADAYRAGLDSPEGWTKILARYAARFGG